MVELWRQTSSQRGGADRAAGNTFLRVYLTSMAVLAWLAVLTRAYIIYPWYRAAAPANIPDEALIATLPTWHAVERGES